MRIIVPDINPLNLGLLLAFGGAWWLWGFGVAALSLGLALFICGVVQAIFGNS